MPQGKPSWTRACGTWGQFWCEQGRGSINFEATSQVMPAKNESPAISDELYVIGLCDDVLGMTALRQHQFDFLHGDPGKLGKCRRLPVDAFYPALNLVIEYRERQHTEAAAIMDRRDTISGCKRGEQRRRYDARRRSRLPAHGITLIELDYSMFAHDRRKRLRRDNADAAVVAAALKVVTGRVLQVG
jgi:hypothetical protein